MNKYRVGIIGASGYSGVEATKLLAFHPAVELALVTSDRWAKETVERRLGPLGPAGALTYVPLEESAARSAGLDAVLLCTPADVSHALAPQLLAAGVKVVDLSGAFRLEDAAMYPRWYGFEHQAPQLLAEARYGLPELFRSPLVGARLVANPGCYATAAALAVAPFLSAGLVEEDGAWVVDAASGTSGAGRKGSEDLSFTEVDEDFRAYRVLKHQHTPEIAQTVGRVAGRAVRLTFTAHLLPIQRGILVTAYGRLIPGRKAGELAAALAGFYARCPMVRVLPSVEEVRLKSVVGTNLCAVAVAADDAGFDPGRVVVVAALDNLVKGAAGQAVQNLNLLFGLPELQGLDTLRPFHP